LVVVCKLMRSIWWDCPWSGTSRIPQRRKDILRSLFQGFGV
jgi:hypothetical protein